MGTYTANKNLYMPTVGETGWGTLMNGNLETIDNFLKPISLSGSTYTFTGNHVGNQSGGSISATSITNSGTLTNTGKITANGGIGTTSLTTSSTITSTGKITANGGISTKALTATTGTFSGAVTGASFNGVPLKTSGTITVQPGNTIMGYIPQSWNNGDYTYRMGKLLMLPPVGTVKYTGSIKFFIPDVSGVPSRGTSLNYWDGSSENYISLDAAKNSTVTLTFSNICYLLITTYDVAQYYNYTLT